MVYRDEDSNRLDLIDALRGVAVLAVILSHADQAVPAAAKAVNEVSIQGARGVQFFFVISALTLLMSWHRRNDARAPQRFLLRRLFRIAPMFYLATIVYATIDGTSPRHFAPQGVGVVDYAASTLFINGWFPNAIASVVPGGWSIAVESNFYLLFPILAARIHGIRGALIAVLASAIVGEAVSALLLQSAAGSDPGSSRQISDFVFWWPPRQFPAFFVGFVVYEALYGDTRRRLDAWLSAERRLLAGRVLCIASVAVMTGLALIRLPVSYLLYAICFGIFVIGQSLAPWRLLINPVIRHIGKVSYSAYFWQFAVIDLARYWIDPPFLRQPLRLAWFYLAVVAVTTLLSTLTHELIERPGIEIGRRVTSSPPKFWRASAPRPCEDDASAD